jgi:hypothetical protein
LQSKGSLQDIAGSEQEVELSVASQITNNPNFVRLEADGRRGEETPGQG